MAPSADPVQSRVVVTGVGLCVPAGPGREAAWSGATRGASAQARDEEGDFPASRITDFDPKTVVDRKKALKLMGPNITFALGACREAWAHSGREANDPAGEDCGTLLGARVRPGDYDELVRIAQGSMDGDRFCGRRLGDEGMQAMYPLSMLRNLPNLVTAQVTIQLGLRGFTDTVTCGESSGLQALVEASEVIQRGDARTVLAGGADDMLDPFSAASALAAGWGPRGPGLSQGAAALVLEDHQAVEGRPVLAELLGYAEGFASADPGEACAEVVQRALADAGCEASQVGAVWVDRTGPDECASGWAEGLDTTFAGLDHPPVNASQTPRLGHLGCAGGAVEAAFAVETLRRGTFPAAGETLGALPAAEADAPWPAGKVALVAAASALGGRCVLVLGAANG